MNRPPLAAVLGVLGAAGVAHVVSGYTPRTRCSSLLALRFLLALATADSRPATTARSPRRASGSTPTAPRLSIVIPAYNGTADRSDTRRSRYVPRRKSVTESK